jgi:hypothetical protein
VRILYGNMAGGFHSLLSNPRRGERSGFARGVAAVALILGVLAGPGAGLAAAQDQPGEVSVRAESFGLGWQIRHGEWAMLRVAVTDRGDRLREVAVRASLPDADGDRTVAERIVATAPGEPRGVALYFRLPYWYGRQGMSGVQVTVDEVLDTGPEGALLGRRLGGTIVSHRGLLHEQIGLIGVVGGSTAGLHQYRQSAFSNSLNSAGGHERTELVQGLEPLDLPDRWMGLAGLDALVWTAGPSAQLTTDRAEALIEWVRRGGHLIFVVTADSASWITDGLYNPLYPLVPRVRIQRHESVDLTDYRLLLAEATDGRPFPSKQIVHEFIPIPEAAGTTDAVRFLEGPDGRCVVVRRVYGTGLVTLVGLDVTRDTLIDFNRPAAEVFWHRVLGRRERLYTAGQLNALTLRARSDSIVYDRQIGRMIDQSGRAAAGVLLGMLVFGAYWAVAGPGVFYGLKKYGLTRHSWLAFVAASGLFTAIAWGGVMLIKPSRVEATHVTFLDHVYGQPNQRARSFLSVMIPWYGRADVGVDDPFAPRERFHNAITPWDRPGEGFSGGAFPDARDYFIESRAPHTVRGVPARATVKLFQSEWAGGPAWEMPRPVGQDPRLRPRTPPGPNARTIDGTLIHQIPGGLDDVLIIVSRGMHPLTVQGDGRLLADAEYWQLAQRWGPGQELHLHEVTARPEGSPARNAEELFRALLDSGLGGELGRPRGLTAAGFVSMLDPPERRPQTMTSPPLGARQATHGWDLGKWLMQPCIIIVGHVDADGGAGGPAPLFVDGRRITPRGRTVVRWVYPLGEAPPPYPRTRPAPEGE